MMKIYDCFTFFNELDLLELRLSELENYVDYFVIVEANKTHNGKNKKFIFEEKKVRYKKWGNKIIYIKVNLPKLNLFDRLLIKLEKKTRGFITRFIGSNFRIGKWKLENFQREKIIYGLKNCQNKDIIMVSDVDEIPRPSKIKEMIKLLKKNDKVGFKQDLFNHYINGYVNGNWVGTKAVKFSYLKNNLKMNPQRIRLRKFHFLLNRFGIYESISLIFKGGWHFNNIGKKEEVLEKMWSKAEADFLKDDLKKEIDEKFSEIKFLGYFNHKIKIVKLDKTFPKTILKNKKKYANLIKNI